MYKINKILRKEIDKRSKEISNLVNKNKNWRFGTLVNDFYDLKGKYHKLNIL